MSIKKILVLILASLALTGLHAANNLNMFINHHRFLDKDRNTILLVDYQIPYRSLVFLAQNSGYFAELKVQVNISTPDSLVLSQDVSDYVGISNKADAGNSQKSYLNRLSFIMPEQPGKIEFSALDINSQRSFSWEFTVEPLPKNALISDVELNSEVRPDSLNTMPKFLRNNVLYRSEPSILLNRNTTDFAYLYLESYNRTDINNGNNLINLYLEKDSLVVMDEYIDFLPKKADESINLKIPLADLKPGLYSGTLLLQAGESSEERGFEFVLYEEKEDFISLFANMDEEYELMRYFVGNKLPSDWKNMSPDKKKRHVTQFWKNMAFSTGKSVPEVLSMVQERIDYANRVFGHLKAGWTSDMGRIYIRNGAPDEIDRDTSSDESRFVRKDYQIWKYSKGNKPVYLFIDIQMNGNSRLIYVDADDLEASNPDWLRYVGSDFDESRLNN